MPSFQLPKPKHLSLFSPCSHTRFDHFYRMKIFEKLLKVKVAFLQIFRKSVSRYISINWILCKSRHRIRNKYQRGTVRCHPSSVSKVSHPSSHNRQSFHTHEGRPACVLEASLGAPPQKTSHNSERVSLELFGVHLGFPRPVTHAPPVPEVHRPGVALLQNVDEIFTISTNSSRNQWTTIFAFRWRGGPPPPFPLSPLPRPVT